MLPIEMRGHIIELYIGMRLKYILYFGVHLKHIFVMYFILYIMFVTVN